MVKVTHEIIRFYPGSMIDTFALFEVVIEHKLNVDVSVFADVLGDARIVMK
jgi:hypothetical protein